MRGTLGGGRDAGQCVFATQDGPHNTRARGERTLHPVHRIGLFDQGLSVRMKGGGVQGLQFAVQTQSFPANGHLLRRQLQRSRQTDTCRCFGKTVSTRGEKKRSQATVVVATKGCPTSRTLAQDIRVDLGQSGIGQCRLDFVTQCLHGRTAHSCGGEYTGATL